MTHRLWAAALLLAPACVSAHSPVPGLGRFYSGMLHPVLAPAALIALVSLGLLLGQRGLATSHRAALAFVLMLCLGLVAGSEWQGSGLAADSTRLADTALLLTALAAAGCALAALPLPLWARAALAGCVGAAAGFGLADMAVGAERWVVVAGTWLGAALLALGVAAVAELARAGWQHVALRVLASWMAAAALLVLGLQWAGPLPARGQAPKSATSSPAGHPVVER